MGASTPFLAEHAVQLYQDERMLVESVSDFFAAGLRAHEGVVMIGSMPRWEAVLARLRAGGIDPHDPVLHGQLRRFSAKAILTSFMGPGPPDRLAFKKAIGGALALASMRFEQLRVFGEMTDILWRGGERESAFELERFWVELMRERPLSLLCACPLDSLSADAYDGALQGQCAVHTHLLPARDNAAFDAAVARAIAEVLEPQLVQMLSSLVAAHRPGTHMPAGQANLFWLAKHMPRTAEKVLSHAQRWRTH